MKSGDFVSKYISEVDSKQIQPNGVDLRLEKVYLIDTNKIISFSENGIQGVEYSELADMNGWYVLSPNRSYLVVLKEKVEIPEGYVGLFYPRSSMFRIGIMTERSLFDTGFKGYPRVLLTVMLNSIRIKKGTRIGQLVLINAEHSGLYDGQYQGDL